MIISPFKLSILILFVSLIINIFNNKHNLKIISEFNTKFKIQLVIIIVWSLYVFFSNNIFKIYEESHEQKAKTATKHALIALTISFCEHFDLSLHIYWIIWTVAFFLDDWD